MCCLLLRLFNRQLFLLKVQKEILSNIIYQRSRFVIYSRYYQSKESDSNVEFKEESLTRKNVPKGYITSMSKPSLDDKTFQGTPDRYKGLTIDSAKEHCELAAFTEKLNESLPRWIADEVRGVWFKIDIEHSDWVPILARNGFSFHHAQTEYVMMCRWLPTTEESNVPRFAHTMIGVGAVVVNASDQVLVVREKYFLKGYPHWKLPGGYVESGEDIDEAAIREVLEETGIETKFNFVISFRHTHGANFGCSDIYFIVSLTPLKEDIRKCDREIMACEWMQIDDYMKHPHVHETNRFFVQKYLEYKNTGKIIDSHKATHPILKRPYTVFNIDDLKNEEGTSNNEAIEKSKI